MRGLTEREAFVLRHCESGSMLSPICSYIDIPDELLPALNDCVARRCVYLDFLTQIGSRTTLISVPFTRSFPSLSGKITHDALRRRIGNSMRGVVVISNKRRKEFLESLTDMRNFALDVKQNPSNSNEFKLSVVVMDLVEMMRTLLQEEQG